MTSSAAARRLGVSRGTIQRWEKLGYLGCIRTPGGQRRFTPAHISEFLRRLEAHGGNRDAA